MRKRVCPRKKKPTGAPGHLSPGVPSQQGWEHKQKPTGSLDHTSLIARHNAAGGQPIRSLAVPGLCTGVGGMVLTEAAEQMRAVYDNVAGGG